MQVLFDVVEFLETVGLDVAFAVSDEATSSGGNGIPSAFGLYDVHVVPDEEVPFRMLLTAKELASLIIL